MKIELHELTIREVFENYLDNSEQGVTAYNGKLNIRPPYQREFVYDAKKRDAVIETIKKGFPLNVMYWVKNSDDSFEVLDGQQRTISFCQYVNGDFSLNNRAFHNLTETEKNQILDYKLMIYFCEGNDKEKLDWFKIINIAGEKLTEQELRNAIYTGEWLSDAKKYFSKNQCIAYKIGERYMNGSTIRQDYLQTVLSWVSAKENKTIEQYMAEHQHDTHATPLKQYFKTVIDWIELTFPKYRAKLMKGLNWGILYNEYGNNVYDPNEIESEINRLLQDDDITKQKGIYEYLLSGKTKEKALSIRAFTDNEKMTMYERQKGICPMCKAEGKDVVWAFEDMHADHKIPWCKGGHTTLDNGQMLCREHNLEKSNI